MQNDNIATSFGDLAQLVEHTAHIRDVNGSIPLVASLNPVLLQFRIFFYFFSIFSFFINKSVKKSASLLKKNPEGMFFIKKIIKIKKRKNLVKKKLWVYNYYYLI